MCQYKSIIQSMLDFEKATDMEVAMFFSQLMDYFSGIQLREEQGIYQMAEEVLNKMKNPFAKRFLMEKINNQTKGNSE